MCQSMGSLPVYLLPFLTLKAILDGMPLTGVFVDRNLSDVMTCLLHLFLYCMRAKLLNAAEMFLPHYGMVIFQEVS